MITSKKRTTGFFDSHQKSWISEERGKKSQILGMPYSVIWSIILIVFFFIAAWIAIKVFWCPWSWCPCTFSDKSQLGLFKDDLQTAVDNVWNSAGARDKPVAINLPAKVEYVCIMDSGKDSGKGENSEWFSELKRAGKGEVYIYPPKSACTSFRYWKASHINITETTKTNNPLCIKNGEDILISSEHGGLVKLYKK